MPGMECTCPRCGAMFGQLDGELENEDLAPDLFDLLQCPGCEYVGDLDEFFA